MSNTTLATSFLSSFMRAKKQKQEKEEADKEKKARTTLFELQVAREQRAQQQADQQQEAQNTFFREAKNKLGGVITTPLPGTGVELGDVDATMASGKPPSSLVELLADPQMALRALQAGIPLPAQAEDPLAFLRALSKEPSLVDLKKDLESAGATKIDLAGDRGLSPPPPGFARPDPTRPGLVPESGGPADIEEKEKEEKRAKKVAAVVQKTGNVSAAIEQAIGLVSLKTTGFIGAKTKDIEGTDAFVLSQALETIRANISFDRLQEMREASPTGGALGQVAVQELDALRASMASLNQGLPPEVLKRNILRVLENYNKWLEAVQPGAGITRQQEDKPASADSSNKEIDFSELPP